MSRHTLRVFNVPNSKTKTELELEFSRFEVPIVSVVLPMINENDNAGYVVVEFDTREDLSTFAKYFPILRRDLVIYRPPSENTVN